MTRLREWLARQGAGWREAARQLREEREDLARKQETVTVPIEEYSVLMEAATREANALELLGEAQERIRLLSAAVMRQQGLLDDLAAADVVRRGIAVPGKVDRA